MVSNEVSGGGDDGGLCLHHALLGVLLIRADFYEAQLCHAVPRHLGDS